MPPDYAGAERQDHVQTVRLSRRQGASLRASPTPRPTPQLACLEGVRPSNPQVLGASRPQERVQGRESKFRWLPSLPTPRADFLRRGGAGTQPQDGSFAGSADACRPREPAKLARLQSVSQCRAGRRFRSPAPPPQHRNKHPTGSRASLLPSAGGLPFIGASANERAPFLLPAHPANRRSLGVIFGSSAALGDFRCCWLFQELLSRSPRRCFFFFFFFSGF